MTYSSIETEYSKLWAAKNPGLFAAGVLAFIEKHSAESWTIGVSQTPGFITLRTSPNSAA